MEIINNQIIYNENINRLFYTIWRNVYIKNRILTDCLFFKNHKRTRTFTKINQFNKHKFWHYFQDIHLKTIDDTIAFPMFLTSISFSENPGLISDELLKRMLNQNNHLTKLKLPSTFNSTIFLDIIASGIPNLIHTIEFNRNYNQPLPISLSLNTSLKKLTFCEMFNQPIDNLPLGLTHLKIHNHNGLMCHSSEFRHPVNISLFKSLVYLGLTGAFNNPIPIGSLNNGGVLKAIKFGKRFNHQLPKGVIPDGVESVYITNEKYLVNYQKSIYIPNSVKFVKVAFYSNELLSNIPINLHTLAFTKYFRDVSFHLKSLPCNIYRLEFGYYFKSNYYGCKLPGLPPSVKEIVLSVLNPSFNDLFESGKYKMIWPEFRDKYKNK